MDEFDIWNVKKRGLDAKNLNTDLAFSEREVWWCSLGKNIGSEQNGKHTEFERPVVIFRIFSPETMWIIPLTSREPLEQSRKECQIIANNIPQTADISQLRLISSKRLSRLVGKVSYEDFQKLRGVFSELS